MNIIAIRDCLAAYDDIGDTALLDEAIDGLDESERTKGFAELDSAVKGFVWSLGARALSLRSRTAIQRCNDLDRSIAWGEKAARALREGDPNHAPAQLNLATALMDRYHRQPQHRDLVRASELFESARPGVEAGGGRLDVILDGYGSCLHMLASDWDTQSDECIAHLTQAIGLFEQALQQPEPSADERSRYLNNLGLSLRAKAVLLSDPALLEKACDAYLEARRLAGPGSEPYVASSANLVVALQDRAEITNDLALLNEAVAISRDVLPMLDASDDDQRQRIMTNVSAALVDTFRSSHDKFILDEASHRLRDAVERMPDGPARWKTMAGLGAALQEAFDYTGEIGVLEQAIAVQELLVAPDRSATPQQRLNLGIGLLARYRRHRDPQDLRRAIQYFKVAARNTHVARVRASAINSEANARALRADQHGGTRSRRREIDQCILLREEAIRCLPIGSLDRAAYQGNLGVDLLTRYELTGAGDDLHRAINLQRTSVRATPAASIDQPGLLAGLADSLAARADRTLTAGDRRAARTAYRRALAAGRIYSPERALVAARQWGLWEARSRRWSMSVEAYALGLELVRQLVRRQQTRADKEGWLADASGMPAAAGFASAEMNELRQAAVMIEDGRAILLSEALARAHRLGSAHDLRASKDTDIFRADHSRRLRISSASSAIVSSSGS
jgi:tetratricopeptide (TPR) repeat protein